MPVIKPFAGYHANPERAREIVAPPYDSLTPAERHAFANENARNYLNAMRAADEYPAGERPTLAELMADNRTRLREMLARNDMVHVSTPSLFLYRLTDGDHQQTGVVALVPVSEFIANRVRKHENTQAGKEDDLVRYNLDVGASSSPICTAYPADAVIDELVEQLTAAAEPVIDFDAEDGVRQTVWVVSEQTAVARLSERFAKVPFAYLTDGHHRAAAAARVAMESGLDELVLTALFPADQLRILEYNRCVSGMNGYAVSDLLEQLAPSFEVSAIAGGDEPRPRAPGEIGMYVRGDWYRLKIRNGIKNEDDPVDALDVTVLQRHLFEPVLGVLDPRTDERLRYMSASVSPQELARVCAGTDEIAFVVHPTSIDSLIAVADAGKVMPPKSTWFDPKLRSGLFLRLRAPLN